MASKAAQERLFAELQDRYGLKIAEAFLAAIEDVRTNVELQRVIAAVQAGNLAAAIDAMHLDAAAFGALQDALQEAYTAGGQTGAAALPARGADGTALVVRFDGRNVVAETWLRERSSSLVTRIVQEQREVIRSRLAEGMAQGANPRTVALDIVGRVNRVTGKREGGVLGLSAPQEQFVRNARQELASGDPEALRNYLGRKQRDRRFDRSVAKAIREERPLPPEILAKAATAYERRLLKLRGDMIGRTEALASLNAAQHEALRQAVDSGAVDAATIRRSWRSAGDLRVRHTHMGLNGDTVGLDEFFTSPSGARLRYPGDTSLGAPASEVIGCRCIVSTRIDFLANIR